ncbi:DUF3696 domain-containing protein [Methylomonas koyamae]|uniref:DUF3696 domain-containing protein n=1 Tax=Methylomonas koyamae TaxID=702114 RepID=UPI000BC2D22C|nr:AAA family ATPase [Methylomonas koyamae]ATG91377.1 hypothetical protein MKLM6_3182 [Methylomonas koyamae]
MTNYEEALTEIALSGFQVFEDLVRIPLRRITLLFGPNSAGKSAVEDALLIFLDIFKTVDTWESLRESPSSFDTFPGNRFKRLRKHWRRTQEEPMRFAERMCIFLSKNFLNRTYEVRVVFRLIPADEDSVHDESFPFYVCRDIEFLLDGESILLMEEFEKIGINLEHTYLKGFDGGYGKDVIEEIVQHLELASDQSAQVCIKNNGWLWITGEGIRIDDNKRFDIQHFEFHCEHDLGLVDEELHNILQSVSRFAELYNSISDQLIRDIDQEPGFYPNLVPASRKIPNEQDLVFLINGTYFKENCSLNKFHLHVQGAQEYRALAESFACRLVPEEDREHVHPDESLALNVNRMLTDYLFAERGYHLDMDYRIILEPGQFDDICTGLNAGEILPGEFCLLVRLFLVDAQGRQFSFDEVGSGLGYVLPVLCEISDYYNTLVMLQQPELHLHPALQAALGDVLIDASDKSTGSQLTTMIVETHSEHLLLRILKRIRQSQNGRIPGSGLRITEEEVSVLYFNPNFDGTTEVKHLRVSPDGEFLDRWPRGFFSERDQELFDE